MTTATEPAKPLVRVIKGGDLPTEDLAALTAVLLTRATPTTTEAEAKPETVIPLWERPAPTAPYRSPHSWRN
ncbi:MULTISPECIES: acyl-CoA carboxylase subunit epsilon [unclassified Streptomyces]|uniref:acyl-CoA carboxylase subunit epsilon n=1 Tax=unclassified Streptomyces TaxID=2593676 RepID=UPI002E81B561|nr:acyl-CoA carboxylase subunit epsilon [Streptomyces sp. NBC_00589]WTI34988.1 acyl-CoA carboxylase subunit epsilon [Streptomyces sp. NBC_00775]WUB31338.1 acyl-CoA carboxylase subunit epsilon [Streptomyces sp. NBC_00589]